MVKSSAIVRQIGIAYRFWILLARRSDPQVWRQFAAVTCGSTDSPTVEAFAELSRRVYVELVRGFVTWAMFMRGNAVITRVEIAVVPLSRQHVFGRIGLMSPLCEAR